MVPSLNIKLLFPRSTHYGELLGFAQWFILGNTRMGKNLKHRSASTNDFHLYRSRQACKNSRWPQKNRATLQSEY